MYPDDLNQRATYRGMISALDEVVGNTVTKLKEKGLYENSIIVFSSDNGAMYRPTSSVAGSNLPLRGQKAELFEGGIRVPGFVHSPKFIKEPG